ncbi:hypothetical protein KEM56_005750 [Ascosphaera pollenicola]|nr:hypothetical protein KEM56_005750 [Ascosphaera pollenicola]
MGNKVSSLTGVRSSHFYEPGNAVNEIWLGNFELISHLPFGAPDIDQTGFQKGTHYPMIPWKPFIIPLSGGGDGTDHEAASAGMPGDIGAGIGKTFVKRAIDPSSASIPGIPAPAAMKHFLPDMKGKVASSLTQMPNHLPNAVEIDFVCWLAMQFLAVIALLVPLWLAVDMLVRAFEAPLTDGKDSREDNPPSYAENPEVLVLHDIEKQNSRSSRQYHERTVHRDQASTGTDTFASTATRASIGTVFYFLAIVLIRAHEIAMHISPECVSILTEPLVIHRGSSPGSRPNLSITQYPPPPSAACPSVLPKYPEDMDKYISGHWSGPYRAFMTSLCVLAVFAVGCLWSDVVLLLADKKRQRKEEQQKCVEYTPIRRSSDHDVLLRMLDEDVGGDRQQTPERISDSSDAIWTLVS